MPLTKMPTEILLDELFRRNPWIDRKQTARLVGDIEPQTLAARDARGTHDLKKYKFGKNGRVKYKYSDVLAYVERQTDPG